jgi:hypothetical protein
MNRREALHSVAVAIAAQGLLPHSADSTTAPAIEGKPRKTPPGHRPYIEADDGTQLFYQDWSAGKGILFLSSMCLNSSVI